MFTSRKRWLVGVSLALYLYFCLPATATLFYELYHLTGIGPVYWGYTVFKGGSYYFGVWDYRLPACVALALAVVVVPPLWSRLRRKGGIE